MKHRYKVREIAQQSGLSEATVDRVLHERPGVRESTRAEVQQAIRDLDKQRTQLKLSGRKFLVDVVMQSPERFTTAFRAAVEAELPALAPAVVRSRFHFRETGSTPAMVETLDRIGARGTQGVIVKAPDSVEVVEAIDRLTAAGIPVVTYATDVPGSSRAGYVGIDNRAAGATAAYLVDQWLGEVSSTVLITLSSNAFRGEEEREMGFRAALRSFGTDRTVIDIAESDGLDATIESLVLRALEQNPDIAAVYSIGGGNVATTRAFERTGRACRVFIAHDLDEDNTRLLRAGTLSAVLHHDLRADAHLACRMLLQARGALGGVATAASPIRVVTPYNQP
ncbi:transcriptional regulator [Rhodococcus opacus M213]|uniref:Transcriptional regulator n=1 Tax=Rhodococcus opacus M213 TaxID=1129896 RepID=K8XJM7_RHOOP|nr:MULTISPECIES: LacI family DNA-binding transcriptional regulator [Rhodococcus]EKT77285.1 transcriptional regulator [Rhodococcus opacus M213]GLK37526.1 DNA-binding protein [Rhodococcus wratislaviensis]